MYFSTVQVFIAIIIAPFADLPHSVMLINDLGLITMNHMKQNKEVADARSTVVPPDKKHAQKEKREILAVCPNAAGSDKEVTRLCWPAEASYPLKLCHVKPLPNKGSTEFSYSHKGSAAVQPVQSFVIFLVTQKNQAAILETSHVVTPHHAGRPNSEIHTEMWRFDAEQQQ